MKDGFEEMRHSFITKFDELSKEFTKLKSDSNYKEAMLESELKKSSFINEVLLKHLTKL